MTGVQTCALPILWDDELEELSERVREAFGDLAVSEACLRALTAAPAFEPKWVEDLFGDAPENGCRKLVDGRVTAVYLKTELRRLLTQH